MPRHPLIGITGREDTSARLHAAPMHAVGVTYTHAIQQAGGTPCILPPTLTEEDWPVLIARLDGLLLSGGEDIAPTLYGETPQPWLGRVDETRDHAELGLVRLWVSTGKPLLAICRGHQVLNVALGGTLTQDILTEVPEALDHAYVPSRPMERIVHQVTIMPDSHLAKVLGRTTLEVNSAHHQAVIQPGTGLRVVAYAPDGINEATELVDHPFCISVQWHPEAMAKTSETMRSLFEAFVQHARGD